MTPSEVEPRSYVGALGDIGPVPVERRRGGYGSNRPDCDRRDL